MKDQQVEAIDMTINTVKTIFRTHTARSLFMTASLFCATSMAQSASYEQGQQQLDERNYQAAQETFSALLNSGGSKQDATLYWLAYSQFKNKQTQAALNTLDALLNDHPESRWLDDARALQIEIKDKAGLAVDIDDEEMKLYALNSLMNSQSERSVEILRKLLDGNSSNKVKGRALFVLSQMNSDQAFELIAAVAKDASNRRLQLEAVRVLGMSSTPAAIKFLSGVYESSDNIDIKSEIMQSFMVANEVTQLVRLATSDPNSELRRQAINQLGVMSQTEQLLEMYFDPNFNEFRQTILSSIAIGGGVDALKTIVDRESDQALVIEAVEKLGITDTQKSGQILMELYQKTPDQQIRKAVIHALFIQSNARNLIEIANIEDDPLLKREVLRSLSMMRSDDAIDYFDSVLNDED